MADVPPACRGRAHLPRLAHQAFQVSVTLRVDRPVDHAPGLHSDMPNSVHPGLSGSAEPLGEQRIMTRLSTSWKSHDQLFAVYRVFDKLHEHSTE
jgi:hypothetical protein